MTSGKRKVPGSGLSQRDDEKSREECKYCNPPEGDLEKLGSLIGSYRHQHYIRDFKSTEELEKHLKATSWFPAPEKGYDFANWLAGILGWHRVKLRAMAQEAERAKRLGQTIPNSPLTTTDPVKQREWAEAKNEAWLNTRYPNDLGKRTFYRCVGECRTPEDLEKLAKANLAHDPGALAVQMHVVGFWKRYNHGKTSFPDALLKSLVREVPNLPPWERGT